MTATVADIALLSEWIDQSYFDDRDSGILPGSELHVRRRVDKIMEEAGEVGQALGGWFGENPRKGFTHTRTDVLKELLDVAVTALGAYESMTGNRGESEDALREHIGAVLDRVGIVH